MYKNILFLGISLFAGLAMAADDGVSLAQQAEDLRQKMLPLNSKIQGLNASMRSIQNNLNVAESKVKEGTVVKKIRSCAQTSDSWFETCTEEKKIEIPAALVEAKNNAQEEAKQLPALREQQQAMQSQYDDIQKKRNSLITQDRIQTKTRAEQAEAEADKKANQKLMDDLDRSLTGLDRQLSRNDLGLVKADLILSKVAAKYDNTVIGAYMREKMAELLASDSMCKVQEMCTNKVPKEKKLKNFQDSLGTELFKTQQFGMGMGMMMGMPGVGMSPGQGGMMSTGAAGTK